MKRRFSVLCLLVTTLVSCSGSKSDSDTSANGSSTPESSVTTADGGGLVDPESTLDPVTVELAAVREANDGRLPLQDSLDLFASTVGAIPGGDSTRFSGQEDNGNMALHAVLRFWDELTDEQVKAVESALGYGDLRSSFMKPAAPPPDPTLQREVDAQRAIIASRLGIDVPFPIVGYLVPGLAVVDPTGHLIAAGGLAVSERDGSIVGSGTPDRCLIKFAQEDPLTANRVAHEVFHCFQFFLAGDLTVFYEAQHWITEGSASWAANDVAGVNSLTEARFRTWVSTRSSLYAMAYEAIGYYWVLDSLGVSPYEVIDDMLIAGGSQAAVAASGLDPLQVLSRAATSRPRAHTVQSLPVSERWDFTSPRVPRFGNQSEWTLTPADGIRNSASLPNFAMATTQLLHLREGSVVRVNLSGEVGSLEFFGKDPIEWNGTFTREFCLEEGGCACATDGTEMEQGSRDLIVAGAQLSPGRVVYDIQMPETAFTDGHWEGLTGSSELTLSGETGSGFRPGTGSPIEFTIEDGVVTSGAYGLTFEGIFQTAFGAATGSVSIFGDVTGCGYSPKMVPTAINIAGTVTLADGSSGLFQVEMDLAAQVMHIQPPIGPPQSLPMTGGPSTPTGFTSWLIYPGSTATHRVGELDASAEISAMTLAGFTVSDVVFAFDVSRV